MHPNLTGFVRWVPMQCIRFVMKSVTISRVDDLLVNDTYEGAMINVMDRICYLAGLHRMAGERHGNCYGTVFPPSIVM